VALSFLYEAFVRLLQLFRLCRNEREELAVEVVMFRHEVAVLRRQVARPAVRPAHRAILAGLRRFLRRVRRGRFFVQPETFLRWHRDLVRRQWSYRRERSGRPGMPAGTVQLVIRLATENPTLGYRRIHGELATMGVRLAPSSVWARPPPARRRALSSAFWADLGQVPEVPGNDEAGVPLLHLYVDTVLLRRLYVLFFIDIDTRRVHLSRITATPVGEWVVQQAHNLSFALAERARLARFLIRDRDTKCTAGLDEVFCSEGIRVLRTPIGSSSTVF
jgi:hypothetical protein